METTVTGTAILEEIEPPSLSNGADHPEPRWPKLYESLTPSERQRCLAAAAAGVVHAETLPPPSPAGASTLGRLLDGETQHLAAPVFVDLEAVAWCDSDLDACQRDAAARALASPDVFLILGAPGTGKTRVVAELLRQTARRGQSALLTAPSAAAVDLALEAASDCAEILPVRLTAASESAAALRPGVRGFLLEEQRRSLRENTRRLAEEAAQQARQHRIDLEHAQNRAQELLECARRWREADDRRAVVLTQKQQLPQVIQQELELPVVQAPEGSLSRKLDAEKQRHLAALQQLDARIAEAESAHKTIENDVRAWTAKVRRQEDVVAVKQRRNLFSWKWWRYLFKGRCAQRLLEFQERAAEAQTKRSEAEAALQAAASARDHEIQRHDGARSQIIAAASQSRLSDLDHQLLEATQQAEAHLAAFSRLRDGFGPLAAATPEQTLHGKLASQLGLRLAEARQQEEQAVRWQNALDTALPQLEAELPARANVWAGPLAALPEIAPRRFDVCIVEQADQMDERQLRRMAAWAERWILIAQPPVRVAANIKSSAPLPRLWSLLHGDPRRLPYRWFEESEQLTCRLMPLTPADHRALERERLADQPEIELRILTRRSEAPRLAEVAFPAHQTSCVDAKRILCETLEQPLLHGRGGVMRLWRRHGDYVVHMDSLADPARAATTVELPGRVTESIAADAECTDPSSTRRNWRTTELVFAAGQEWTAATVTSWLARHLPIPAGGRTAWLEIVWRATPAAAKLLAGCWELPVVPHACPAPSSNGTMPAALQFLHVPSSGQPPHRGKSRGNGVKPGREESPLGGSVDLADVRQRQQLPLELQVRLPRQGAISLGEARVIFDAVRAQAASTNGRPGAITPIRILAWSATQAVALQALWEKEAAHASPSLSVQIHTVAESRETEADVVFLSLCPLGDARSDGHAGLIDPWCQLLTSARERLILVGDWDSFARLADAPTGGPSAASALLLQLRQILHASMQRSRPRSAALSSSR